MELVVTLFLNLTTRLLIYTIPSYHLTTRLLLSQYRLIEIFSPSIIVYFNYRKFDIGLRIVHKNPRQQELELSLLTSTQCAPSKFFMPRSRHTQYAPSRLFLPCSRHPSCTHILFLLLHYHGISKILLYCFLENLTSLHSPTCTPSLLTNIVCIALSHWTITLHKGNLALALTFAFSMQKQFSKKLKNKHP